MAIGQALPILGRRQHRKVAREWQLYLHEVEVRLVAGLTLAATVKEVGLPPTTEQTLVEAEVLRLCWQLIDEQSHRGAPILPLVHSARKQSQLWEEEEVARYLRELPTVINLGLLLVCLPATLILLFVPLIWQFSSFLD